MSKLDVIRAKEDRDGELYIHVDDLMVSLKEDIAELLQDENSQIAIQQVTMILLTIKNWYQPTKGKLS